MDPSTTMATVVGINARLVRERRGWDQDRVADEAAFLDLEWDVESIELFESGGIDTSVSDLLRLATVLGVAPHLLLYPPPGTAVYIGHQGDEPQKTNELEDIVLDAETHISASELANWIWNPDPHSNTHVDLPEIDLWGAASEHPSG